MAADIVSPELEARLNANATEPRAATSTRRKTALAKINAAILAANERQTAQVPESQKLTTPGSTLPLNEEKKAPPPPKLTKDQEAILKAQEKLLGKEEAARLRKEQEDQAAKSKFLKASESTLKNAGKIVHGADARIGSVPTPGSIAFPLILLLLFFFILIQVAGYSRLGWLWLVLTGNARMSSYSHTNTNAGVPVVAPEVPENQPATATTGGGASQSGALAVYYPILPANGVFRLGEY